MVNNYVVIVPIIIAIIAVALGVAYQTGALDPIIEKIGVYYFKAEAKAEEKKMEAQGMTEGEDFLKGEISGNQKADMLNKNLGDMGKIGKGLM
ncbi:hypothetical protein V8E51_008996 [Hyaloscypha variabilis]|uniref:Uncharacterized protein n=1 Tax=Hyaloscypha variabilis (strain UAMH 11265 / GT02V1 / F) TaxID=1149755 RepID=A0A2J6S776_HYAVF|nr:hypothetical protein L207DRAFT_629128 [Hyaloscypha variabilis F]